MQAIAAGLDSAASVRVLGVDQFSASDFDGIDLLVMGSPTHA
jgi:hypothetical protein